MIHTYDDFNDKDIVHSLPGSRTKFDKNGNWATKPVLFSITGSTGDIIELKIGENEYVRLNFQQLKDCVIRFEIDQR
jgi:hypothetical protein